MKYVILDISGMPVPAKRKQPVRKKGLCLTWLKRRWCRKLQLLTEEICCGEMEFVKITLLVRPKELADMPADKVCAKIRESLKRCKEQKKMGRNDYRLFAFQPELWKYIPAQLQMCEDREELLLKLLQNCLDKLCTRNHVTPETGAFTGDGVRKKLIYMGNAGLIFLDDGTRETKDYILTLSKDWNYVTVCSDRCEEPEALYRQLYEEEGLMVQCENLQNRKYRGFCKDACKQEQLVIDLTSEWKGIHHAYPEGAFVLDVTFSKEKREYLKAKGVSLSGYLQVADVGSMCVL